MVVAIDSESDNIVVAGLAGDGQGSHPLVLWLAIDSEFITSVVQPDNAKLGLEPDGVRHLHVDTDGVVVIGRDQQRDVWLARYREEALEWETSYSAMDPRSPTNVGSAMTLRDGKIALVTNLDLGGAAPIRIAYFDGPDLDGEESFAGPEYSPGFSNIMELRAVPANGDDDILVFGGAVTQTGTRPWLQRRRLGGDPVWEVLLDSQPGELLDRITHAVMRDDGSFVVSAARRLDAEEMTDVWVGGFSADGEALWSHVYAGEYHRDDTPTGIAADTDGNVYVHLTLADDAHPQNQADFDFVLLKLDSSGAPQWVDRWTGTGDGAGEMSWDISGGVAVDEDGFVVVTGSTFHGALDYDVVVRKLAP